MAEREGGVMTVELTDSQVKNVADFIEFNLLEAIRQDCDIDNINWVADMCEAYKKLREAEAKLKELQKQ